MNGTVSFLNGYTFYRNASWTFDRELGILTIALPTASDGDLKLMKEEHIRTRPLHLEAVDMESKTLKWTIGCESAAFYFQLFLFELDESEGALCTLNTSDV
jgi:hypothetical protein|tara:strand:- start:396 stop:698 length:303 start_codon:yes stop_codon:yes gene_type:complete